MKACSLVPWLRQCSVGSSVGCDGRMHCADGCNFGEFIFNVMLTIAFYVWLFPPKISSFLYWNCAKFPNFNLEIFAEIFRPFATRVITLGNTAVTER